MTAVLSPAAARRVFLTLTVTRWFPVGLVVGILTLWPLERGLTIPEALSAMSLTGITVFLLELPTSGFAERSGASRSTSRRRSSSSPQRSSSTRRRPGGSSRWPRC